MPNIDDELRSLLADRAERAPTGVALLAGAKARSRQRLVRRRAALSGLTVVAVGASVTAAPVLVSAVSGPSGGGTVGAPPPSQTTTAAPISPGPSIAPHCNLQPVTEQPTVSFPYRPTVTPPGAPAAAVMSSNRIFLSHRRMVDDSIWIAVDKHDREPTAKSAANWDPTITDTQVRGRAGKLATGESAEGSLMFLFWLEKPGVWLTVTTVGVSRNDLISYANGLREETLSNTEAYRFALLPAGLAIVESLHWSMVLGWPVNGQRNADGPEFGVIVTDHYEPGPDAQPVQVGGHNGYLVNDGGSRSVSVKIGESWLQVVTPTLCAGADAVRLAAGVTVDLTAI